MVRAEAFHILDPSNDYGTLCRRDGFVALSYNQVDCLNCLHILGVLEGLKEVQTNNVVNHPSHYTQYRGLEVIDLTEQMNFNRGNAVKYICRAGFKGDENTEIEDLEKARWYISREIDRLKKDAQPDGR